MAGVGAGKAGSPSDGQRQTVQLRSKSRTGKGQNGCQGQRCRHSPAAHNCQPPPSTDASLTTANHSPHPFPPSRQSAAPVIIQTPQPKARLWLNTISALALSPCFSSASSASRRSPWPSQLPTTPLILCPPHNFRPPHPPPAPWVQVLRSTGPQNTPRPGHTNAKP